ncbi:helix-turn-helix transcriptional regulator [Alicyclobacillus tolerans]|uniref:winged helix-turn-helix transcriptional regulator n=1 Tax=Alicyclobacillus tolerans TaxID=90970 RepID=UPI001F2D5F34|nr:helix-turn-helix domain-containing protein [Alicyclobacillus tolerans]MCF8567497.1 helix-turn-helix transcriptional regulator [Alicyclobacillus tolerans]
MCPKFKQAFDLLGKRWTGLILRTLCGGPKRFSEIAAIIPDMSERMLSERFRELERAGIVQRTVYPETPIRIEYDLTEKGKALHPVVEAVQTWADGWVN